MSSPTPSTFFKFSPELMLTPRIVAAEEDRFVLSFHIDTRPLSRHACSSAQAHALVRASFFRHPVRVMVALPTSGTDPEGYLPVGFTVAPVCQEQYESIVALDAFVPEGLGLTSLPHYKAGIPIGADFVPDMAALLEPLPEESASEGQLETFKQSAAAIVDKILRGELVGELAGRAW